MACVCDCPTPGAIPLTTPYTLVSPTDNGDLACTWDFVAPAPVTIRFTYLNTEAGADEVDAYDDHTVTSQLFLTSGNSITGPFVTSSGTFSIGYFTDFAVASPGFVISIT